MPVPAPDRAQRPPLRAAAGEAAGTSTGEPACDEMEAADALLRGLVHDLRNSLFALSANLEGIEFDPGNLEEVRETCRVLHSEHERLGKLTDDLAALGRPGRPTLPPAPLLPVLEDAARSAGGVEIDLGIDAGEAWHVQMDRERLLLALTRLIAAAGRQAAGVAVRVAVRGDERAGRRWVGIAIGAADASAGAEPLPDVFEPYSECSGRGDRLGLAIARRIAAQHGGSVTAERAGDGLLLRLDLPCG